jgi:type IV pilus assembly protein PilB
LIDIGVQPFLVASSVMAVMAQRLVRKVCPKCQEPEEPDPHELKVLGLTAEKIKTATFMRGRGCTYCHHTGYRGRLGIFELMQMNSTLREMSFRREPTQNIRRQARLFGMRTLLEDGVLKALKGITTLEEVLESTHTEAVTL